jgi:hypothetical protein
MGCLHYNRKSNVLPGTDGRLHWHQLFPNQESAMKWHRQAYLLLVLIFPGCQSRSEHLHYVLPNDFRGAIVIFTERADGETLPKEGNRYICRIPANGMLQVKGKGPCYQWHTTSAAFENGQVIPVANEPQSIGPDTVAFWGCGSRSGGMVYDFIGTKAEYEQFCKDTATADIKPGSIRAAK